MTEYNGNHPIIKKAKMLSGDNPRKMTEEEMRSCAEYCRRLLQPTTAGKAEIERKAKNHWQDLKQEQLNEKDELLQQSTQRENQRI